MTPTRPRRRFTTDDYRRMLEAGILCEGEPVELLAGEIYVKAREGHSWARRRGFSPGELDRMQEAGILGDGESTAPLAGEVREAASVGSRHWACVNRLTHLLAGALGHRAILSVQSPVVLDDESEPEPDLAVITWREDFYRSAKPGPVNVLLLIEVADTTYPFDRRLKLPLYARAGIVELWIVDLGRETIEAHLDPAGDAYRTLQTCHRGDTIAPRMLADLSLPVDEILP